MALPTSPSVVVLENDLSIYAPNVDSSVVGIVGFANKGPVNKPILVTSQTNLLNTFGEPDSTMPGQGLEGALEILETTNQLYYVRVASSTAAEASSVPVLGYCPALYVSSLGLSAVNGCSLLLSSILDNNGVEKGPRTVTLVSSTDYTSLSDQLKNYFSPDLTNQDVYHVNSGGNNFLVSRYAGSGAFLSVSSLSGAVLPIVKVNPSGDWGTLVSSANCNGGTFASTSLKVFFESNNPGSDYNVATLKDGTVKGISVEVENSAIDDRVRVNLDGLEREVFNTVLSPSSAKSLELLLTTDTANNKSDYIHAYLVSGASNAAINAPDDFGAKWSANASIQEHGAASVDATATPRFIKLIEGTYNLAGGDSGLVTSENDINTVFIGNAADKTGIYALDDDQLNISVGVIPGINTQSVQNAFITLAETSKNYVAAVSPPDGLDTAQEAVDWINGKGNGRTSPLNNSYVAVYWPWVQTFNVFAGADEWYDPAIFAIRQMTFTDSVAEPWFAPAGFRRGRLTKPVDIEVQLNQGDKNVLYVNNVNPISKEPQLGITIMGQKTAQRLPSALDRVNVRRLMIYIRKVLLILGKPFQFEPNDSITWEAVEDTINPFISELLARRAIVEGAVKCDSATNTPLRVDRNELWCSITIKPTKAAETIVFEVNLTNQSATING